MADDRLDRVRALYDRAVFGGDAEALDPADAELDAVEADLALERGRILHARYLLQQRDDPRELALFERAAELYHRLGQVPGEASALFGVGLYHQVVRSDGEAALPALERAYQLAVASDEALTRSYVVRHLGFYAMERDDLDTAREHFEESLRLRRELGFRPGVAAALLALAEVAAQGGDPDRARALLDEATTEAEQSGARQILHWIGVTRAEVAAGAS
jgi:tetratricopeptide (TPR) repeat protein